MSETSDKRRRGDLDLFVLALINSGVSTPYELMKAAGLSPGATIPALRRLEKDGFVLAGRVGSRGRSARKVTAAGRRHMDKAWREFVDQGPSGDLDADLRVALLALLIGGDRRLAAEFLRQSASTHLKPIAAVEELGRDPTVPPLAFWYRRLRARSQEALGRGEAAAALAMAKALPRNPLGEGKSGKSTSRG